MKTIGVVCVAAAVTCATFIAQGEEELVGEDKVLAAALAARRGGDDRESPLRGWRPPSDPLDLSYGDDDAHELPPAELALMEAAVRRGTRRRQGNNFTYEADEATIVYKSIQLMFHAYYASQARLEALHMVVKEIESEELFLMGYAFKKMETWLAAAKSMYFQVVSEHNREVNRPIGHFAAYEKYGTQFDDPKWKLTWTQWILSIVGWQADRIPLYQSAMPLLKYPYFLPYNIDNLTIAHIHHQQLLVWRNYTLAVHLMVDVTYTCKFVEHLNDRLRTAFKLDQDDSPIN